MNKILVTGSNGYVGTSLCRVLRADGCEVVAAARQGADSSNVGHGPLSANTDWSMALHGTNVVVHLAARVHQMHESRSDAMRAYREMNVDVTLNLAQQAIRAGVSRFVFVSSVKVNGETSGARPFTATDVPAPDDAYGLSKWEAEQGLQELGAKSGMEIVIVRPPLVYGPGVRANFLRLMNAVHSGIPLPLAMVRSPRSLVALDNLADFLRVSTTHPRAAGKVWMVSDQHDVSIAALIRLLAAAMRRPARLLPVPPALLAGMAAMLGKRSVATRILDPLQVDARPASELLDWSPVASLEQGIQRTVDDFLARLKS